MCRWGFGILLKDCVWILGFEPESNLFYYLFTRNLWSWEHGDRVRGESKLKRTDIGHNETSHALHLTRLSPLLSSSVRFTISPR